MDIDSKKKVVKRRAALLLFILLILFVLPFFHSPSVVTPDPLMAAEEAVESSRNTTETQTPAYPPAPKLKAEDYPSFWGINSRIFVWLVAQLHLWFGAFVLAVPIFVLVIELIGLLTKDERYDKMAYEFIKVSVTAYSFTALFGGLLIFGFVIFYPDFFRYLTDLFGPLMLVYALLFFGESASLYIYYYGWGAMKQGFKKHAHLFLGLLLNLFGTALMILANSMTAFMMAPSGVDAAGAF